MDPPSHLFICCPKVASFRILLFDWLNLNPVVGVSIANELKLLDGIRVGKGRKNSLFPVLFLDHLEKEKQKSF